MRWLFASVVVHALVLWLLVGEEPREPLASWSPPVMRLAPRDVRAEPTQIVVEIFDGGGAPGGSAPSRPMRAAHVASTKARSADVWSGLSIRTEGRGGSGTGEGDGQGRGNGIGFGAGGGVHVMRDVPAPPPAPPASKARPAKLVWPTRDEEVEDEDALFIAKVTVDEEGSVVGARMLTNRPGSRGERAANAIWTFRYAPALDDDGHPIRATFEQPFQVR